jgi:hypothetical protein
VLKALEIAAERFARGELSRDEFEEIKRALSGRFGPLEPGAAALAANPPPLHAAATSHLATTPRPQPLGDVSEGWLFAIGGTAQVLLWMIRSCFAISAIQAIIIFRQSDIQKQYDMAFAFENDPLLLSITLLPYLATMVLFLFWKKKSTDNLFILRGPQSVTPAGAVYWYFVPVAWFWKPYEAMRNLVFGFGIGARETWLLPAWWGLFWGGLALLIFAAGSLPDVVTTQQQARFFVNWSIALYVADFLALVAAGEVVDKVTKAQAAALRQRDAGGM